MLTWFDGERWAKPIPVTDEGLDIWRPSVVVDGEGKVWVLWSQNIEGNRDILAGRFDPEKGSFSKIQRLTFDPGADIHVVAAKSASGRIWIAWQGGRGDNFDILAMPLAEGNLKPLRAGKHQG